MQYRLTIALLFATLMFGCSGYLDKPRPIAMRCTTAPRAFLREAASVLSRNGYTVVELDSVAGYLRAQDTLSEVYYRYTSLIRTWHIRCIPDSVVINVESLSTRLDDSEVRQTWDKRWAGEDVREWMRPVLNSLETACGLGNPLMPR